jgi:hypothetical protein
VTVDVLAMENMVAAAMVGDIDFELLGCEYVIIYVNNWYVNM